MNLNKMIKNTFFLFITLLFISCGKEMNKEDKLSAFEKYIVDYPSNKISITSPIKIELKKALVKYKVGEKLPSEIISISPDIEGNLRLDSKYTLSFYPNERLEPASSYDIKLSLDRLYEKINDDLKSFSFNLNTVQPSFKISNSGLQSEGDNKMYLKASVEVSDYVEFVKVKKIIEAEQEGEELNITWNENQSLATFFEFKIEDIKRSKAASELIIRWNGKAIRSENSGEKTIVIPAIKSFEVLDVVVSKDNANEVIVNFSDALKADQNFKGLVSIGNETGLNFDVSGNSLSIYPDKRFEKAKQLLIDQSVKNQSADTLKSDFSQEIVFKEIKPAIRLISKGSILPGSSDNPFYFEAINLKAVDVHIVKIYENNILQFLQNNDLGESNYYKLRKYGRIIARKTIPLITDKLNDDGSWKAYAIDLTNFFEAEPGAIYQVQISYRRSLSLYDCDNGQEEDYSFESIEDQPIKTQQEEDFYNNKTNSRGSYYYKWKQKDNPCDKSYYRKRRFLTSNLLASNLGLTSKSVDNKHLIAATDILTAQKLQGVDISFYNYQKKLITKSQTNANGITELETEKNAAFVIAEYEDNFAYLNLNRNKAISLSNYDVSGKEVKAGLEGFIYNERGVYRPGDTIFTTFVLNDNDNQLPDGHPIKVKLKNARGKLVYQKTKNQGVNNFYRFELPTRDNAPTGNWIIETIVGGVKFEKTVKVASVKPNRLKIQLDFDKDVVKTSDDINFKLKSQWLSGATANSLKAKIDFSVLEDKDAFSNFEGYIFSNPVLNYSRNEKTIFEGSLNSNGIAKISKAFSIKRDAPGMLKLSFLTKVFENGGDFSIDVTSKSYAPYDFFVGVKKPKKKKHHYDTDRDIRFNVKTLDYEGKKAGNRKLKVSVFKIDWHWWWNRGEDNLSRYKYASNRKLQKTIDIQSDNDGNGFFKLNINEENRGRYFIQVEDEEGHSTGFITYFFKNWWSNEMGNVSKMLVFSADKEKYNVGDQAKITFPSNEKAIALLTVENGSKIIAKKWVKTQQGTTTTNLDLTKEMAPNAYVSISFIQQHQNSSNDRPIRLFGVIPIEVVYQESVLKPEIDAPNTIRPESDYEIKISEKNGNKMTYTLAVVDQGLLDLTNFKTPDIHKFFNSKKALGVYTHDVYDDVIGAYSGTVNNIFSIGGGDEALGSKNKKANRFKPVVDFIGPVKLKEGEVKSHQLYMENYVGAVKVAVVAGDVKNERYGKKDQSISVKKPLMLLASAPRKISPGEEVSIPVTVFNLDEEIKSVKVSATNNSGLKIIGGRQKQVQFDQTGDKIVTFDFKVLDADGVKKIDFKAQSGKESAKYKLEIDSYNPNTITQKLTPFVLKSKASVEKEIAPYGQVGTNKAYIEFSSLPPIDISKRIENLVNYPHGCAEQITSKAFPQIYLSEIADLPVNQINETESNVQKAIEKLGNLQRVDGSIPYWQFGNANEWCTSYVGHFMLEAKHKGFSMPISFMNNWKSYQSKKARMWKNDARFAYDDLTQAYRLFTLALAGSPNLAAMNKLKQSGTLPNAARWRLALSYAVIGQNNAAREIIKTADVSSSEKRYYRNYGSAFRNQAMLLESLVAMKDERMDEIANDIAEKLSSDNWLNTQETAFGLVSMAKLIELNKGKGLDLKLSLNGSAQSIQSDKALSKYVIDQNLDEEISIEINNKKEGKLYARLIQSGKRELKATNAVSKNIVVKNNYTDAQGKPLDISNLRQGAEINLSINVTNTSQTDLKDVALNYFIPSGWEYINTSYTEYEQNNFPNADYVDARDNEIRFYFDLDAGKSHVFQLELNASYKGAFFLPATYVESMYDNRFFAQSNAQWIQVFK
jgi:hypothetical protein